jgi:protein SCO1/2
MFGVSNTTPRPKEGFFKDEPSIGPVAGGCSCRQAHDSPFDFAAQSPKLVEPRARVTTFRLALALQAMLFTFLVPSISWSHDPTAAEKIKGVQRREVSIPVRDFSLTDQTGRPFEFRQLKGKVVLLAFGYTTCPDVCPLVTAAMRRVQLEVAPREKKSVYFLTITTDPEIDSPKVLSAYAKRYEVDHANWVFLTGSPAALGPVWKNFGVGVVRKARGLIDHTPLTALIDPEGVARFVYLGTAPQSKVMLADIRGLLKRP